MKCENTNIPFYRNVSKSFQFCSITGFSLFDEPFLYPITSIFLRKIFYFNFNVRISLSRKRGNSSVCQGLQQAFEKIYTDVWFPLGKNSCALKIFMREIRARLCVTNQFKPRNEYLRSGFSPRTEFYRNLFP